MEAKTFEHVSAMPAPTWGFLKMNDATVEIPGELSPAYNVVIENSGGQLGDAGAFESAMEAAQASWDEAKKDFVVLRNYEEVDVAEKFGGLALSNYQVAADEMELARSLEGAFEMGVGGEATEYLQELAGGIVSISTKPKEHAEASVRVTATDGCAVAAALDLVAAPGSELEVVLAVDSPQKGVGVTGSTVRIFAGAGARVTLRRVQTLDETWTDIDDVGLFLDEDAVVDIYQTVLGAGKTYTGLAGDLRGEAARADVNTHYLGHGSQELDFNYTLRHHGPKTECNINTTGVLAGTSSKTLRATIDLIRGCKGAVGAETENVLIVDEGATNKTVPTILCNEDDVMGNHGATIGHIRAEQLFYLASRGLSQEQAEGMFVAAALEDAFIQAPNEAIKASVLRLGSSLVENFEDMCSSDQVDIRTNPYKKDFPLFAQYPDLAFLDSAATAQRPERVIDAQGEFYRTMNANPLRGLYEISLKATSAIRDVRESIAGFIGAPSGDDIVFARNTSEALNLIAYAYAPTVLEEGDEVVITIMEHHSNMIPWQQACKRCGAKLVYLYCDADGQIPESEFAKIGPKTKIVSCTHVSNVLGVEGPVKELAERAHAHGAVLVVDGAQSVPHIPINVTELGCDFFVFSGHKAFGPFGVGVLWGKHELLESSNPFLTGGEMIDFVSEQDAVWSPVPEKFEAGTQDAAGIYATGEAIKYMLEIGHEALMARENALVAYLMDELSKLEWIELIGPKDPALHHGAVSFNVRDIHPHDVSSILSDENVAIRAGHHCAQPLLNHLGIRSCCRASVAFYNDASDIDALIDALKQVWGIFHGE